MNKNQIKFAYLACAVVTILALAACGGGGGGGGSSNAPSAAALSLTVTGLGNGQSAMLKTGSLSIPITANGNVATAALQPTDTISISQQPSGQTCELVFGYTATTSATAAQLESATSTISTTSATGKPEVDCSTYPAVQPPLPQVGTSNGTSPVVTPSPIVTPVFFSNDPAAAQAQETTFLQQLVASKLWSTLSQYGVGAATVAPPIVLSTAAASLFTNSTAQSLTQANAATWSGGALDPNRFFIFYVPNGTTLDVPGAAAYHSAAYVFNGSSYVAIPYAVVPLPSDPLNQEFTEHELMEGSADPTGQGYLMTTTDSLGWQDIGRTNAGEIGDMCDNYTTSEPDLPNYVLQPIWSNLAAGNAQAPCVPTQNNGDHSVFGAALITPSTLSGASGNFENGAIVQAGGSVTTTVARAEPASA